MAEYLTASQYAERYGINVQIVRRMCARKEIDAVKIGSVWRIADHPPGGRASEADLKMAMTDRRLAVLEEWKEKVCEVFSLAQ